MPAKSTKSTKSAPVKPARKGTARVSAGPASPVRSRKVSPAKAKGTVKLGKPTPVRSAPKASAKATADRRAGKRVADANAKTGGGALSADRVREVAAVGKLRAKGLKWEAIAAETGLSLSALARIRLVGKREGIAGFTR